MEEIAVRSWDNPIIKESYEWMLKVGRELEEKLVLVGGWATYLQAQNVDSRALPSLGIDFVALKENFREIEKHLLANNFVPASFRYIKYYHETLDGGLKEICFEESNRFLHMNLENCFWTSYGMNK